MVTGTSSMATGGSVPSGGINFGFGGPIAVDQRESQPCPGQSCRALAPDWNPQSG